MSVLPWCDYCGKYILNKYKIFYGYDLILIIRQKSLQGKNRLTKLCYCIVYATEDLYFPIAPSICFCSQKCKDAFAKELGLRKRVKRKFQWLFGEQQNNKPSPYTSNTKDL